MSMYTKDIKEPSQEIYFLNDDNIAFDKNDMSCAAGFNAIASQKEFTEVYSEVKTVSSDFYALSSNVETSAATLDGKIDGVSAAVDIKFLPLSGGAVDHLSVSDGLTARGLIDTDYVKTNSTGDITVRGANGHGSIDIQFEGGMNSISVNGASLSSYIRDSINELDVETVKAGAGKIFDEIKQRDGKINATLRDLVSADIPVLPVSKISCLEDDYATKVYADSHISAFTLRNDGENRALWLTNNEVGLHISVDTNNFIKDGMIDSVLTANGGTGLDGRVYPPEEGPYIWIKWNTESGTTDTWLKIKDFANLYSSGDPGVKVEDFKILLDYDVVAKAAVVSDLVAYATELSTPATGIIDTLSAGIDSALSSTALTVKFLGHITIYADETRRSFMQILEDEQLFDEQRRVKNGSMYQVTYLNSSGEPVGSESRYQTTDGLVLGDGDYVYVHKHGLDAYVQADEIAVTGDNKTVYLADPVHRYDIAELRQFVIDNFVKLSGNNEIEGGNLFHGVNSFDGEISVAGDLSVGFDKLFDLRDGKSLNDLSCEISSEIEELSAALSGEIDTLSAKLSGEIDSLSVALSGEIDTLSVKLSGEIDNLSAALSGEIDTLSAKLSGEIDSLSVALSGEIDTLSAKLSGEIDSLSVVLSGEISARAMISVDEIPTNEFKFQHISRDEYHDLVLSVDGKTTDPNTLYVVSSDNTSMYGQKITDLADGELSDDACTYGQLSAFKAQIKSAIDEALPEDTLEGNLTAPLSAVVKCLFDIKTALA